MSIDFLTTIEFFEDGARLEPDRFADELDYPFSDYCQGLCCEDADLMRFGLEGDLIALSLRRPAIRIRLTVTNRDDLGWDADEPVTWVQYFENGIRSTRLPALPPACPWRVE